MIKMNCEAFFQQFSMEELEKLSIDDSKQNDVGDDDNDDDNDDDDDDDDDDGGGGCCGDGDDLAEDVSSHFVYNASRRHRRRTD